MSAPEWVRQLDFLHDEAVHEDPYPILARLRAECPVAHMETQGGYWIVTRHEDVHRLLKDNKNFSNRKTNPRPMSENVRGDLGPNLLIQSDPPEHFAFRQIIQSTFTPGRADEAEPVAREVSVKLLEELAPRGECEFVRDFAVHVPGVVMMPLLGVPPEDYDQLLEAAWGEEQKHAGATPDPEQRMKAMKETRARQVAYFRTLYERRQETGPIGDDLASVLVAARVDGRPLTMTELLNLTLVLYNAGLHTTTNTLSNMMVYLSQHADQRDRLVNEPQIIPAAIEELMRWESIVTGGRQAKVDIELGGCVIPAGDVVMWATGSAGRDQDEMGPDADEVDFDRGPTRHFQFGAGPHRCIGSHLARMELIVAMEEIHRRIPTYRLKPGTTPKRHTGMERGTEELWLVWD
ncbi:MAG: cytochrome P450 [Acidimicrobiaceae bacterium]|nr:cytochrome P450 [Acidimicrobiaceae bacterium]